MSEPNATFDPANARVRISGALAVLGLAVALRAVFFTGYHGYDDVFYIKRAFELSGGEGAAPGSVWEGRVGLVGPTALVYRALGVSAWTTSVFTFVCSLLGVLASYLLGARLQGPRVGLLAALLVAMLPIDVLFATQLFANAPVVLLSGLGFGAFVLGERSGSARAFFASGAAFGVAMVVHEAVVMSLAFYPVYVVLAGRPRRAHAWVVLGLVLGLSIDPAVHALLHGEPRARLHALRGSHAKMLDGVAADVAYSGLTRSWIGEGLVRPFVERTFGLFTWLLVPAIWIGLRAPRQALERALALIVLVGALWILFGSTSPTHYSPLSRMPRYLVPLTLPAAWLLASWLERQRPAIRGGLVAALGASSLVCLTLDSGSALVPYEHAREELERLRPPAVWVEDRARFPLRFAFGMQPPFPIDSASPAGLPSGSALLATSKRRRAELAADSKLELVAEIDAPLTPYLRLLRSEIVIAVLRATRPPERFAEYAAKMTPARLAIYRVR